MNLQQQKKTKNEKMQASNEALDAHEHEHGKFVVLVCELIMC